MFQLTGRKNILRFVSLKTVSYIFSEDCALIELRNQRFIGGLKSNFLLKKKFIYIRCSSAVVGFMLMIFLKSENNLRGLRRNPKRMQKPIAKVRLKEKRMSGICSE